MSLRLLASIAIYVLSVSIFVFAVAFSLISGMVRRVAGSELWPDDGANSVYDHYSADL